MIRNTFLKYLVKLQLKVFLGISLFVFSFIGLFSLVDIIRKIPKDFSSPISSGLIIALCKSFILFNEVFGYVYFVSAVIVLWKLANTNQITIMKTIGKSARVIISPFLKLGLFISVFWILSIHPCCMYLSKNLKNIENILLQKKTPQTFCTWISKKGENKEIIYIYNIVNNDIDGLSIFYDKSTIYASKAKIKESVWELKDGYEIIKEEPRIFSEKNIKPPITIEEIFRFSVPSEKCDVYDLLKYYLEKDLYCVDLDRYIIAFNKLLASGFMLLIFAMIAAALCLPLNRYKTKTFLATCVISIAIISRTILSICESIGKVGVISPVVCVWAPVLAMFCFSLSALIWREY